MTLYYYHFQWFTKKGLKKYIKTLTKQYTYMNKLKQKIIVKEFREDCQKELGYISSIFMSQGNTRAGDIIMPTEELKESADRFELYLFKALKAQRDEIIEKIRKMEIEIKEDEDKFERSMREDMSLSGAIGYNKAIEEIIKTLK